MQPLNFVSEDIYVLRSTGKGRGIFTNAVINKNTVIEIAPVIVMSRKDRSFIDKSLLHDYIFEWGEKRDQCCMALGYIPLYNHSYNANCEYEMNFKQETITIRTVKRVRSGEELFINYNGDWNNNKKVWFDVT